MEELRQLDEVAYVRFASVYRSFQDINAFQQEIERLRGGVAVGLNEPVPLLAGRHKKPS
jgi:transcriptional repressor NrdR